MARRLSFVSSIWLTGCLLLIALLTLNGCAASLGTNRAPATPVAANTQPNQTEGGITVAQNAQPGIGGTGKTPGIGGTGQIAGTPPGIGSARDPQVLMKPGDVVEVGVDWVGAQESVVM